MPAIDSDRRQSQLLEAKFRGLLEAAPDAMLITNAEGRIVLVNAQAERMFGYSRAELLLAPIEMLVPERFRERHPGLRTEYLRDARPRPMGHGLNLSGRRKDGSEFRAEISLAPMKTDEGVFVTAAVRDVSAQAVALGQSLTRLAESEARLAHVVSSSPAVLYALRRPDAAHPPAGQLDLAWISPNVERVLGYTLEEALTPNWWADRLHPDDAARVFAGLEPIFVSGVVEQEYRFRRKGGEYRWMRAEMRVVKDAQGGPFEIIGSWADVSERKQAELDLMESEAQYRLLFESNPQPMWVYDALTLAFLAVNDAALRHYGYTRDEWLALTVLDIRPPEEVAAFKRAFDERTARPEVALDSHQTFKHRKRDGTIIEVEVASHAIRFEGRSARLILATDVTDKRSLEAQLLQSQKMESIGRLAGGVAHDFNNLLGVISGYGELLRKRVKDDPRLSKYAEDIIKAAERAAALTRQLLAFSRKQVLQPKVLDLNSVVGEMEKMLRRLIGEDVQLVTVFDDRLGTVKADPGQIEQVLMNLAVNARDAMPVGGRLTIETHNVDLDRAYVRQHPGVPAGRYVMLAMSDTGEGMSPEVRARAFEPFFTTKEAGKGTGLGLATVHGIVKQSGGHVFVYSEPGRGATFKIYFPRADEEEPRAEAVAAEPVLMRGTETVLLVEDEATLRQLIRECLESSGYAVLEAGHGAEAIALAERHPGAIDLLMTDVVMPGLSGRELAAQVVAARPGIRIVYMSGYTDDAVVLHGVLSEDMAFLQKPFTEETLTRKVREVLDARG